MSITIPNVDIDAKFKYVEKILNALLRRSIKHVVAVQPPMPISHHCKLPDNGLVMSYMFPAPGKITSGSFWAMDFPNDVQYANLSVTIKTSSTSATVERIIKNRCMNFDVDLEVAAGTCLSVHVPEDLAISDIWCGFMYQLETQDMQAWNMAIDSLDKVQLD